MPAAVLAIDQGTTGTRVLVVDATGRVLADAYRAHGQHHPFPGWVEHDAAEIWRAIEDASAEAVAASGATISAVGLSNQGETVLAWDRVTGLPIGRAIVWQDDRTRAEVAALAEDEPLARRVKERTGLVLDPYFSASKLRWLLRNTPEAAQLLAADRLVLGTLDAWLIWKITAGRTYATDASTAARTLLFDIRRGCWDPELAAAFGLPPSVLPEVVDSDADRGPSLGLPAASGAPLTATLVDQPAALFGHGCLAPGTVKATYGTGAFIYLNLGSTMRPSTHGLLTTIAWRRDGATTYALDGGVFAVGSVVNWLCDHLRLAPSPEALDRLAGSVERGDGLRCVPALVGLGPPHWRRAARGAFVGLELGHGPAHLARAALEGIAFQVVEVVRAMEADAGTTIEALHVDGGVTASRTLMQLQADLLGVPVEVAGVTEATAMGTALLAMRAAEIVDSDRTLAELERPAATVYEPRRSSDERNARCHELAAARDLVIAESESAGR